MKMVLQIPPIECAGCMKQIEGSLLRLDGVKSVHVFPRVGKVRIECDKSKVAVEQIETSLLTLNYPILSMKSN